MNYDIDFDPYNPPLPEGVEYDSEYEDPELYISSQVEELPPLTVDEEWNIYKIKIKNEIKEKKKETDKN